QGLQHPARSTLFPYTTLFRSVLRWEGEGYRTQRLEALLERDAPGSVDKAVVAFTKDVERLKELEAEVAELDPQAAGDSVFRDPRSEEHTSELQSRGHLVCRLL